MNKHTNHVILNIIKHIITLPLLIIIAVEFALFISLAIVPSILFWLINPKGINLFGFNISMFTKK